ncbi:hypothetical protein A8950_3298 [Dongia mobilis]|uniref:DUF1178 family protein n=1 Tax=Dongia mobilis TaxID=578943 RepID=A0A4R6WLG9_9PROT|nr:DUF1178 family protein [Dongia mobilis]TDQ78837.1 hypothetical protein A8950_3298 [Dongia mobilis]
MILFQLSCSRNHSFDIWFKDGNSADRQLSRRMVECPECGDRKVAKALMAPRIGSAGKDDSPNMAVMAKAMRDQLAEMRRKVEENCDYVGERFADEARKIHYGEAQARGIYGEASDEQHRELAEEGIEVARVPWLPRDDA